MTRAGENAMGRRAVSWQCDGKPDEDPWSRYRSLGAGVTKREVMHSKCSACVDPHRYEASPLPLSRHPGSICRGWSDHGVVL
jgi:hypothetical protein